MEAVIQTASPYTYTARATRETLYELVGTFSTISVGGQTIYNAGTLTIDLPPGAAAVFTSSVVSVAVKRYRH